MLNSAFSRGRFWRVGLAVVARGAPVVYAVEIVVDGNFVPPDLKPASK